MYDRMVTEMGADANAYTTDDYTAYHMSFTKDDLEKVDGLA
ncbi:MAG: insulinase family protein, partial [Holophaga sp.]|nr:insulinase family protein [Holophaga sp.]